MHLFNMIIARGMRLLPVGAALAVAFAGSVVAAGPAAHHPASSDPGPALQLAQMTPSPTTEIQIDGYAFGTGSLTVTVGTEVVWINHDDDPHTVVSEGEPRLLKSPPLGTGDRFSFTFTTPGTYKYFCSIHPHMTGTIIVK